ncbi:hypothetical protein NLI96_g6644 [Meripilus lineatus]|uniref:HTH APSES-type domain-containing protein n=1 Tax=Meripilus lineatus TaxID=2056292 RepID=A0AAD5V0N2_9APHY|nr:hypothetical protein NLI96_g6644 [Physisporinus lineatus]
MQRPPLPVEHANPHIKQLDPSKPPPVKFQEIMRDGQATVVGRIKIPTPNGHAFILRRLDTGAISLTTMFRAAFPTATEEAEKAETSWVKSSYDTAGANKSGKARFAGTWVSCDVALSLADGYSLAPIVNSLVESSPDPNYVYRRSTRAQQASPPTPISLASVTASPKEHGPNPAKRRREESPVSTIPRATSHEETQPVPVQVPSTPASKRETTPTPRSVKRDTTPTSPERSTRRPLRPVAVASVKKTPKVARAIRGELVTPGSDETAVDDEASETSKLTEVNMADDIREQRELIERLKTERNAKAQKQGGVDEDEQMDEAGTAGPAKRAREEGPEYTLNIREPEVEERQVVSNSRVRGRMAPKKILGLGRVFLCGWVKCSIFHSISPKLILVWVVCGFLSYAPLSTLGLAVFPLSSLYSISFSPFPRTILG